MEFGIRRATIEDADSLAELAAVTFPLACPESSDPEDVLAFIRNNLGVENFAAYLQDPQRVLFVAQESDAGQSNTAKSGTSAGGRLLAYTMLVDAPAAATDVAAVVADSAAIEFSKCYAHPDAHGTGAGAAVVRASLEWVADLGRTKTWLGVNSENVRAQKFYRKHGFAVAGTRSFQLGTRTEHDYVMVRST